MSKQAIKYRKAKETTEMSKKTLKQGRKQASKKEQDKDASKQAINQG